MDNQHSYAWLEVTVLVEGEQAEAVAELLSRYIPDGVAIESTAIAYDPFKGNQAVGPWKVCGYLPLDDRLETTRQKIEEGLWHLSQIQPIPAPVFTYIQEVNWVETWKQHYKPIAVGQKLMVLPVWFENPDPTRLPVRINPGMAFGTGTHPTTQLSLELLENLSLAGETVIDVGCGSAILGIGAVMLGAVHVLGVDTDTPSIEPARENVALNHLSDKIQIAHGSVKEILGGQFQVRQGKVVVANILATILVKLLDEGMANLMETDGRLVLSGIMEDHIPMMTEAFDKHRLKVLEQRQAGEWIAFTLSYAG